MTNGIKLQLSIIVLALLASAIFAYLVIVAGRIELAEENQLMEHIQILILGLGALLFWRTDWVAADTPSRPQLRLAVIAATAMSLSFCLREVSTKSSGIDWLVYWTDGSGFKILMLLVWSYLIYRMAPHWRFYLQLVRKLLKTPTLLLLLASLIVALGSALFDKGVIQVEFFRFYEEVLEMNGYTLLLLAAINCHRDITRAYCDRL